MQKLVLGIVLMMLYQFGFAAERNDLTNTAHLHKITVTEFFSYGCPGCYKIESALKNWRQQLGNKIVFIRIPVEFSPQWQIYAKAYETLTILDPTGKISDALFSAIQTNQNLQTVAQIADFVVRQGLDRGQFLALYHSSKVAKKIQYNQKLSQTIAVYQVPTFVVDRQHPINLSAADGNFKLLFAMLDASIAKERKLQDLA